MFKRIAMLATTLIVVAIPLITPEIASADTIAGDSAQVGYVLNADDGRHLTDAEWCNAQGKHLAWPDALKSCNTGGGTVDFFDKATSSYVLFRDLEPVPPLTNPDYTPTNGQPQYLKTNRYTMYIASPGKRMTFYKGTDANGTQQYYLTSNAVIYKAGLLAEPNSDPDYKYNWTGAYSLDQYYSSFVTTFDPNNISGFRGFTIGNDLQAGQVGAVNVDYAASWDMAHFTNHVPFGTSGVANCGTLDIGCWVGKLTDGFTNVIKGIFGLFVDGFQWLFVPDGSNIQSSYNDLTTFMNTKLGFLAYPFTFIGNVFSAFTSGSSWCNSSSCSKDFGNLFGHPFNVNLGQMQNTMPSIWTWFTAMLRGLTILALLLAVRQKYRAVTQA